MSCTNDNGRTRLEESTGKSIEEKHGEDRAIHQRQPMIGFDQPVVVNNTAEHADVDQTVQGLPAPATQATNPTFSGSQSERYEQDEAEEAHGDERTLGDVFPHAAEIEGLVRANISEEVQTDISEREEAEHAAEADEVGEIQELTQGRDSQRDQKEAQRPVAGEVLDEFNGIGGELTAIRAPTEIAKWRQAKQEDGGLGPAGQEDLA